MPFLVWKTIGGKKRLVMRWNKRIDGKPKIIKEVYIGDMENLARMIQNPMENVDAYSLDFGMTAAILMAEKDIGLKTVIDNEMGHHASGLSPGDYALIFIMNRLSDPRSKSGIHEWMAKDFSSTLFHSATAQGFWNIMDRFSDEAMKRIREKMRDRLISLGYDDSRLFVDGSNFYTYMEENDMAKKGHNKKHRYDLNQVSYYIAASYDYIPFTGDSYAGNIPDVKTFQMIVDSTPDDAILIFDRGYNSRANIKYTGERKYLGALIQSDHRDIMSLPLEKDSFIETRKPVYGRDHRIIVYHSSKLERRRIITFMKHFRKVYRKVRRIIDTGDSDSMEKARFYLEAEKLNETIILPTLKINSERMQERLSMLGKNALFTNIDDMNAEELIDLYRKRNRVEHCFRTISMNNLASPVYHWTPQKIRVHMFFSYLAYMFLALIYNRIRAISETVSLASVQDLLRQVRIQYIISGKEVRKKLDSRNPETLAIADKLNLISVA